MCITNTRLSRKLAKSYRKLAGLTDIRLGPRVVVFTGVYTMGITSIPKAFRYEVTSGKEVGGMMYVLNDMWRPQLLNFKDDPTGLGVLTSIKLRHLDYEHALVGARKSLRLEDKLNR